MNGELNPCPFCGSNKIKYWPTYFGCGESHGIMRCLKCGCSVPTRQFGKHVGKPYMEWNRRVDSCNRKALLDLADDIEGSLKDFGAEDAIAWVMTDIVNEIRKACGVANETNN